MDIVINTLNENAFKFSYRSFESKLCWVWETLQLGMAMLCLGQLLLVYLEALESILEELKILHGNDCYEIILLLVYDTIACN